MHAPSCEFSLILEGSIRSLIPIARKAVRSAGGAFTGDVHQGAFEIPTPLGPVSGFYAIEGVSGDVTITRKPESLQIQAIKNFLTRYQKQLHATRLEG